MKTSTLIPVVAYLGLAGYTAAAPVNVESTQALDKRTFCFFGIGWGCPAPAPAPAPAKPVAPSAAVPSKAVVSSSSAVKSSAVASSSAKVVSSAAASSSAKAVVPTSASATKVSTAAWSQCTDFDWNSWGSDWTWGGGFDKDYVKSWYVAEYGFAPPQGMNWKQVSSLVSKFGQKTKPASPKTTSKFTGKGCSNPWTSVVNTKTAVVTAQPVTSIAASKPAVTSAAASSAVVSKASSSAAAASSAAASKPASSAAASSASASVAKPVASSSSSAVVVAPASSAASSAAASSAASSAAVSPVASSAAASSAAASPVASSAAASSAVVASSDAAPVASSAAAPSPSAAAPSSDAAPAASSAAVASPSPDATSASSAAASPSAGTGSGSDGSSGTPGTGSGSSDGSVGAPGSGTGVPGTGAGSNTATGTSTSDAPVATSSAPSVVNGFTAGGCVQEVSNRLLDKVQTSSPSMTIEMCTATCDSYGYAVAGLEYGSECYCGTLEDIENTLVSGECKMACSGDSSEVCGGPNAINIYIDASNVPATVVLPAGWTTYGVVTEGQNGRLLPVQILNDQTNTVEVCANACAAAGYTISGTEYSSECYCGNAFSAAANGGQLVDDSAAFMTCSGNGAQKCGGPSILSVTSAYGNNIPSA